jgi:hypothetical protein
MERNVENPELWKENSFLMREMISFEIKLNEF